MTDTFTFEVLVKFEIAPADATKIIADPNPGRALMDWLKDKTPAVHRDVVYSGNTNNLENEFGKHEVRKRVTEAKRLVAPMIDVEEVQTPEEKETP